MRTYSPYGKRTDDCTNATVIPASDPLSRASPGSHMTAWPALIGWRSPVFAADSSGAFRDADELPPTTGCRPSRRPADTVATFAECAVSGQASSFHQVNPGAVVLSQLTLFEVHPFHATTLTPRRRQGGQSLPCPTRKSLTWDQVFEVRWHQRFTFDAGRPADRDDLRAITKLTQRTLARRVAELDEEIGQLDARRRRITKAVAPALVAAHGIGPDTATGLLLSAGDNPDRLGSERSWAALLATNPIPASSGKTKRHRYNPGGDRQGNSAIWRIVMVRMASDPRTKAYVERRTKEGLSKPEIIRCLKATSPARPSIYNRASYSSDSRSITHLTGFVYPSPVPVDQRSTFLSAAGRGAHGRTASGRLSGARDGL